MHRIQGVSVPRSGHHLLVNCLKDYFGDELGYCANVFRIHQFSESEINYQKNHDFNLDLPVEPGLKYLIQYRHPLESLVSWYKWEVRNGVQAEMNFGWRPFMNRQLPIWNLYTRRDTRNRWTTFLEMRIPFWTKFIDKWIIDYVHPNVCYVNYSDLVQDPFHTLSNVLDFFKPGLALDEEKLLEVIAKNDIRPKSNIKEFKHYDETLFRRTENMLIDYLNAANIENLYPDMPNQDRQSEFLD